MLGKTHAISGIVTGAVSAEFFLHADGPHTAALAGFTAGTSLLLDLDSCGSSAGRCLGFISRSAAWVIRGISGGHRHGTHTLAAVGVFTALAWIACHWRATIPGKAGLALLVAIAVSGGLEALGLKRAHTADIIAACVAGAVIWLGFGLALIPLAVGLGCATHLLGDAMTDSGVPLLMPFTDYRFKLWPEPFAFSTGTRPERQIIVPLFLVALAFLAYHAVDLSLAHQALVAGKMGRWPH